MVDEDVRHRLSVWCAARIPDAERERRQIGYAVEGAEVVITDRRAPARPEMGGGEWTSTPLALLVAGDGGWTLYRPVGVDGWEPADRGDDPVALLDGAT